MTTKARDKYQLYHLKRHYIYSMMFSTKKLFQLGKTKPLLAFVSSDEP